MPTEEKVRWSVRVSKETDLSLRSFLDSQGMQPADLSEFVEQAVLKQVFQRTVEAIRARNSDADPAQVKAEISAAIQEVRQESRDRAHGRR